MAIRRKGVPATWPTPRSVAKICALLEEAYGSPRHGNPRRPLDNLVYILLSNRTAPSVARRVYAELKTSVHVWDDLLHLSTRRLRRILVPAGLANKRTKQLKGALDAITATFGKASLTALRKWPEAKAQVYLSQLPGVSTKVAKCVLMYSCGRQVLPVDVHVHRVSQRLGWHSHKRSDQSHETLEAIVPRELRYGFHVNALAHGRVICLPTEPLCGQCVLRTSCAYFKARNASMRLKSGSVPRQSSLSPNGSHET